MRRVRPRFSLLTVLLLTTIDGLAIVVVQLGREVGPLRKEVRRLRDEVGELSIENDTRIHAMQARTKDPLTWKFRVWVPEGQTAVVKAHWGDVPRAGVPEANAGVQLELGEQWITYRVDHSSVLNSWSVNLEAPGGLSGQTIQDEERWWEWPRPAAIWGTGVQHATGVFEDGQDVFILKRWRVADTNNASDIEKMETSAGFIIWLERQ
jgi:hypothetical protein